MGKGLANPDILEYGTVQVQPHSPGRLRQIIEKEDTFHISFINNRGVGFLVPEFGHHHTKGIQTAFLKIFPLHVEITNYRKKH